MLSTLKVRMFTKAIKIKMERGEDLEEILEQYTKLTEEEKDQLREALGAAGNN